MNCERVQDLFSALYDDALAAQDAVDVQAHMQTCAACTDAYAHYVKILEEIRDLPEPTLPPMWHDQVMVMVRAEIRVEAVRGHRPAVQTNDFAAHRPAGRGRGKAFSRFAGLMAACFVMLGLWAVGMFELPFGQGDAAAQPVVFGVMVAPDGFEGDANRWVMNPDNAGIGGAYAEYWLAPQLRAIDPYAEDAQAEGFVDMFAAPAPLPLPDMAGGEDALDFNMRGQTGALYEPWTFVNEANDSTVTFYYFEDYMAWLETIRLARMEGDSSYLAYIPIGDLMLLADGVAVAYTTQSGTAWGMFMLAVLLSVLAGVVVGLGVDTWRNRRSLSKTN